jgi:putative DNA primase/helicase
MTAPFVEYVEAGLSVMPIRADGSKAPPVPWLEYTTRHATIEEAQRWAEQFEGVAIIGGKVSGNLEVIDVDEPALVRPFLETVKAQDPGLYDRLCLVRTPRRNASGQGGCHVIFRCEGTVPGNTKLAMSEPEPQADAKGEPIIDPSTGKQKMAPRTLIETRGEHGYILAVGCSARCHPSGNLYEHVHGPKLTDLETLTPAEQETLRNAARFFDRSVAETHDEPTVRGYERAAGGESPGDAFNRRATWAEILGPLGWQRVGESGGIARWRRPGKSTGISATTGILSKAGNELLTVFSTNAAPFEGNNANGRPGVCYSKFAAYALLSHRGNFEDAAKELVKLGYGIPAHKTESDARVLRQTAEDAERRYFEMMKRGEGKLISLGIPAVDRAIGGGVEKGEFIVIGGLTSHGKSVCALQALRAVVEIGQHGILISHEMPSMTVAKRLIQSRTRIETERWWEQIDRLERESQAYWAKCGKLFVLEQCRNIVQIESEVSRIAAEFAIGLIVIDHAQLTQAEGKSRYEILTNASGRFKQLAVAHNCPVLVPSQLNREAAHTADAQAHHLKESGALEQDADVVILVRWPWKADPDKERDPKRYLFKIVKNRNRPIVAWEVVAQFNPARQTIEAEIPATPEAPQRWTEFDRQGWDDETEGGQEGL